MTTSYIIHAKRTAIGSFGGVLSSVRIDDLLAELFKDYAKVAKHDLKEISDTIIGCANQAGEDNRNLARMSLILAGYPLDVPGTTINRLCGSSLDAVMDAHARIQAGFGDCFIAGGGESMSRAPYVMSKSNSPFDRGQKMWDTAIGWRFENPKMAQMFPLLGMGETAEEVQKLHSISREDQDKFALASHQKAVKAQAEGKFKEEILAITVESKKGSFVVENDEGPRADTSLEKLAKLRPAFKKDGTVTAGNSSSINDGASMVVICSEEFLKRHNIQPIAKITGGAVHGLHPNVMGLGPVGAIRKLCDRFKHKISDFDIIELNEAFAVQALGCIKELELDMSKINRNGGSIAIGHPLGASGTRILTTMLYQMKNDPSLKKGLASMCIGVGQGIAVSVERC
ncbi:thiolase family protein [Peredibacter sp. HCB2-198]|uniref:thiolase family protein n=1 Tax=Peredibacter sp. HCB2-198 TaxID=3383025 RepID=UPI0038B5BB89